ncbi:MAG: phosphate signaling complex protein PhoU [Euryarchaeota archaeon]|nr:phosphate signaling complex protein PhoU [Euryarchaeota archaeon]
MGEILVGKIKELKSDVLDMGKLAVTMLKDAVEALKSQNTQLAETVLDRKTEIARMDEAIEEKALRMIALYHPVSRDMRTIAAALKMITYLTRIGRYAKDIAKTAVLLANEPHLSKLVEIPYMADKVVGMIDDALTAFENEELAPLENFAERDDEIDALYYSIFRESITYMMEDAKNITKCIHYIIIARYLERCGDHACKIAEKVHYMVTGEHIEIK